MQVLYLIAFQRGESVRGVGDEPSDEMVNKEGLAETEYVLVSASKQTIKCSGFASFLAEAKPELM